MKKTFLAVVFCTIAVGAIILNSAKAQNQERISSHQACCGLTEKSDSSYIQPAKFPEICTTCKGNKGWYVNGKWISCSTCNGTGYIN